MSDAILETERLVVVPLTLEHAEAFLAYHIRNREHLEPFVGCILTPRPAT